MGCYSLLRNDHIFLICNLQNKIQMQTAEHFLHIDYDYSLQKKIDTFRLIILTSWMTAFYMIVQKSVITNLLQQIVCDTAKFHR
jgi:hypothetical protein